MKQKKYFLTYNSSKDFYFSNKHLIHLIEQSNIFDGVYNFSKKDLSSEFVYKHKDILNMPRGGGYWLWKVDIIDQLLNTINDNDILLYMDSGSTFNFRGKEKFEEYCAKLNASDYGLLNFSTIFKEKDWTTKNIFDYFDVDINSDIANSPQLEATNLIFQKNKHSNIILKEFTNLLDTDQYLITDKYNISQKYENFRENRHDQSIFSLLSKIYGSLKLGNETQFNKNETKQYLYPILSTRHSRQNLLFKTIYYLNYKKAATSPRYFIERNLSFKNSISRKYFYFKHYPNNEIE